METTSDVAAWLARHQVDVTPTDPASFVGIGHALGACRAILGRLQHADAAAAAGVELPRGVLFHGPAGTGKTLTGRWFAGELGGVPAFDVPTDDLTPARVRSVFGYLATQARSVVFLPEIDAIGLDRRMGEASSRRVLFALLEALDGLRPIAPGGGPLVIATTNRSPGALDAALVRAGRLGLHVGFRLPTEAERAQLFRVLAARLPVGPDVDWNHCAELTTDWTPADIRAALEDSFGLALLRDGSFAHLTADDLVLVIRRSRQIDPDEETASVLDRERTATHEAGHVAVALALGLQVRSVRLALNGREGRTDVGEPERALTDAEAQKLVVVAMAGSAAEAVVLGTASHGSRADVANATRLLMRRIEAGTDPEHAPVSRSAWGDWVPKIVDEAMSARIGDLLATARGEAAAIVDGERARIEGLAAVLRGRPILAGLELSQAIRGAGWASITDDQQLERYHAA